MGCKDRIIILVLVISTASLPAQALEAEEFYAYLNSSHQVTSIENINYNLYCIDKNTSWQTIGNIKMKPEIVGYRGLVRYNEAYYINDTPDKKAIIQYDLDHTIKGKTWWDWGVTSLDAQVSEVSYNGKIVQAIVTAQLDYYKASLVCTPTFMGIVCHVKQTHYKQVSNFSVFDLNPPGIYPNNVSFGTVSIYNNTISPKMIIAVSQDPYILGYQVIYNNESFESYYRALDVDHKPNGFPYGNITDKVVQSIYENSSLFSRVGPYCIINSTSPNNLTIYALTPYGKQEINYTIMKGNDVSLDKGTIIHLFRSLSLFVMSIFLIGYFGKII